jgi:myo-inositol-1(or 4)-monophosphatase
MTSLHPTAFSPAEAAEIATFLVDAAQNAGRIALDVRARGLQRWTKAGDSPVTDADLAADAYLRERLTREMPAAGWLSEETTDAPARLDRARVFIVDPIDGTRAFMAGFPDWCVSVALVEAGRPVAGALVAPVQGHAYRAAVGAGATRDGERLTSHVGGARAAPLVAGPRRMIDAAARALGPLSGAPRTHSLALRIAGVADGAFDLGFAGGQAHDWDLAAADLLLHEAGGRLVTLDGSLLCYNQPDPVHGPLVACGAGRTDAWLATLTRTLAQAP